MEYSEDQTINIQKKAKLKNALVLRWLLHLSLFIATFFTITIAGVIWVNHDPFDLNNFFLGIPYSIAILFFLTCHEFGHYFASRYHNVDATLPFYIPFPPIFFPNFGTFGALIRVKSIVPSKKVLFDIGVAGPIAGFFASLIILIYGFLHLPTREFILSIHPDYNFITNASTHAQGMYLAFGNSILYTGLQHILTNPIKDFVPPMSEIYHYPFLCAGWFGLFVTALNLIPMGQLDGGHVIYSMFGDFHRKIARAAFFVLLAISAPALTDSLLRMLLEFVYKRDVGQVVPLAQYSWSTWFIWALIGYYVVKLFHPPVADETPLDSKRKALGWSCIAIFILCFSFNPIIANF
jgi:membrane-associated protease RseP (regulator of RpoE activity)